MTRNICRPEEANPFFVPILELAGKTGVAFLGLTHLSKNLAGISWIDFNLS
jgi:hypothetical protein